MVQANELLSLFDYDKTNGKLYWRHNPNKPKEWNTKYAGKEAGGITHENYRRVRIGTKYFYTHRIIWAIENGKWPDKLIDHKNTHNKDNNYDMLREANNSQNMHNSKLFSTNSSGYKGVSFCKKKSKYRAYIVVNYKQYHLGYFDDPKIAHEAYKEAALNYAGEFARMK